MRKFRSCIGCINGCSLLPGTKTTYNCMLNLITIEGMFRADSKNSIICYDYQSNENKEDHD